MTPIQKALLAIFVMTLSLMAIPPLIESLQGESFVMASAFLLYFTLSYAFLLPLWLLFDASKAALPPAMRTPSLLRWLRRRKQEDVT